MKDKDLNNDFQKCPYCGKEYKKKHFYDKHISICKKKASEPQKVIKKSKITRKSIAVKDLDNEVLLNFIEKKIIDDFTSIVEKAEVFTLKRIHNNYRHKLYRFNFIDNEDWNKVEKEKVIQNLCESLTYSEKKFILQEEHDYWLEYFNTNPFTFPRIHNFEIIIELLNYLDKKNIKRFDESDTDKALIEIRKSTLSEDSAGGKARDVIKLCRWLGLITVFNINDYPLKNILTRKGKHLQKSYRKFGHDKAKMDEIKVDILTSCKFYHFFWIFEKDQLRMNQHKIRPFNFCIKLMSEINTPISNEHLYLTLFRTKEENLIPNKKLIEIFDDIKNSIVLVITKSVFERVLLEVEKIVEKSTTFTIFKNKIKKKTNSKGRAEKGYSIFKRGKIGYKLIEDYYNKRIEWDVLIDNLRLKNISSAANREVGAFLGFLSETSVIEKVKNGFSLTENFKSKINQLVNKPTIWYYDIKNELGRDLVLYAAFVIEFLNHILKKEYEKTGKKTSLLIKINQLEKSLSKIQNKLKIINTIQSFVELTVPSDFIEEILNFLIKYEVISKVGDMIKISNLIDFDIEYDIPRFYSNYLTISSILKRIQKMASSFTQYQKSEYYTYIDFDKEKCNPCILKHNFKPPCLLACQKENGIQRMNFIMIKTSKSEEWRPITCLSCKDCTLFDEPSTIHSFKYPICKVCPSEKVLSKNIITDKPSIKKQECISCLLCGIFCKFKSIIFDNNLKPNLCDPNSCQNSCVSACKNNAITLKTVKAEKNYLELLNQSISNHKFSFQINEFDKKDHEMFLNKINENENIILNPWVSLVLSYFLKCERITRFERLPSSQEMDLCLYQVDGDIDNNMIYELKVNYGDALVKALIQVGGYRDVLLANPQNKINFCKAITVKDLDIELKKEKRRKTLPTWKKFIKKNIDADLIGNISPDCLWHFIFQYYQGKEFYPFKELILNGENFNIDWNYYQEFKTVEL